MQLKLFHSRRYEKTPHVCFGTEGPLSEVKDELPKLLEAQLRSRFKSLHMIKAWFSGPWAGVIQSERNSHSVMLGKSKYDENDWILVVAPARTATLLDHALGRKVASDVADVMLVCREIHALLTNIRGIAAIRWYFEGSSSQSAAVTTPDDLPWSHEV